MTALRRLDRDKARPYNFASPSRDILVRRLHCLAHFEKDKNTVVGIQYINIHDGTTHTLHPPTLFALPQTLGQSSRNT